MGEGHEMHMPGFAHELSDQQIATLSNYLLDMYGNPEAEVTVDQVEALRDGQAAGAGGPNLLLLARIGMVVRSEEHTSQLQSRENLVCRLLLEKIKKRGH